MRTLVHGFQCLHTHTRYCVYNTITKHGKKKLHSKSSAFFFAMVLCAFFRELVIDDFANTSDN